MQVPLFWQGCDIHSSMSISQLQKKKIVINCSHQIVNIHVTNSRVILTAIRSIRWYIYKYNWQFRRRKLHRVDIYYRYIRQYRENNLRRRSRDYTDSYSSQRRSSICKNFIGIIQNSPQIKKIRSFLNTFRHFYNPQGNTTSNSKQHYFSPVYLAIRRNLFYTTCCHFAV